MNRIEVVNPSSNCFPTPLQESLLRAAILLDDRALAAWEDWKRGCDLDTIDYGSARMLPLAYQNLRKRAGRDRTMELARGAYRRSWYRNQILFREMLPVLDALDSLEIESLLLKGAALAAGYYRDIGLRPMDDFDLLVRKDRSLDAIAELERQGWVCASKVEKSRLLVHEHAMEFRKPPEKKLDLHWAVVPVSRESGANRRFWQGAVQIDFMGRPAKVLNAEDTLLHVCTHGVRRDPGVAGFRWCVDAIMVLRRSGETLDWDRVATVAIERRSALAMHHTLTFLSDRLGAPVPAVTIEHLRATSVSGHQKFYFRVMSGAIPELVQPATPEQEKARLELTHRTPITLYRHLLLRTWSAYRIQYILQVRARYSDAEFRRLGVWRKAVETWKYLRYTVEELATGVRFGPFLPFYIVYLLFRFFLFYPPYSLIAWLSHQFRGRNAGAG